MNLRGNFPTPRRALFVTRFLECGGIERTVLNLIDHLDMPGWTFTLATLDPRDALYETVRKKERILAARDSALIRWLRGPGVLRKFFLDVHYWARLQWLLIVLRPDILVTTCLDSMIVAGFTVRLRTRWIGMVGSDLHEHLLRVLPRWQAVLHLVLRAVYHRPQHVVAASSGLRQVLMRHFGLPPGRVSAIHNMVDVARVDALAREPIPDAQPYILGVGRLVHVKGFDLLLRAFARVARVRADISLVLLGSGTERESLQRLARRLDVAARIRFIEYDPNPWRYMRQARVVVAPSRAEGFANVVAEAQACGAPLIVSDCAHGPREIVAPGRSAVVVPTDDVERLTDAILTVLDAPDLRASLSREGRERAALFGVPRISERWRQLLGEIAR